MSKNRSVVVSYVDLGYHTAREVWEEVGLPAYERFKSAPTRATAMDAAVHAWHIHDWIWHEANPGIDTGGNTEFADFRRQLFKDCAELEWVRDIAEATKHRGLGRANPPQVQRINPAVQEMPKLLPGGKLIVGPNGPMFLRGRSSPLTIELPDGKKHEVAEVLKRVIEFWQERFAAEPMPPLGPPA